MILTQLFVIDSSENIHTVELHLCMFSIESSYAAELHLCMFLIRSIQVKAVMHLTCTYACLIKHQQMLTHTHSISY